MGNFLGSTLVSDKANKEFFLLLSDLREELDKQNWDSAKDVITLIQQLELREKGN